MTSHCYKGINCIFVNQQSLLLKTAANAGIQETAVPWVATWDWLQKFS